MLVDPGVYSFIHFWGPHFPGIRHVSCLLECKSIQPAEEKQTFFEQQSFFDADDAMTRSLQVATEDVVDIQYSNLLTQGNNVEEVVNALIL